MNDPLTSNPSKPGAILAQERMRQNLTVNDVANKLRISIRQIEAMEADEYDKLPGVTFVRGFLRNYARLLHLDPEPLLQASGMGTHAVADLTPVGGVPSQHVRLSPEPRGNGGVSRGGRRGLSALLLIAVAGAIAWWLWQQWQLQRPVTGESAAVSQPTQDGDSVSIPVVIPGAGTGISGPSTPPPTPAAGGGPAGHNPASSAAPGPAAAAAGASAAEDTPAEKPKSAAPGALGVIRFEFSAAARIEVRDKNNFLIHEALHKPSDIAEIQVRPPVGLVIGNAKNVKMLFNGRPIDLTPYTDVSVARFTLSDPE